MAINGIEPGTRRIASLILPPRPKASNKNATNNKILTRKKYTQFIGFCSCHDHFAPGDYSDVKHTEGDGSEMFQAVCKTWASGTQRNWTHLSLGAVENLDQSQKSGGVGLIDGTF
jgi:hypothetical protein